MQGDGCVRIGYVIDNFGIGGTELNALRIAEALDRRNYPLTVFHFSKDGPLKARYEALGVDMIHLEISKLHSIATAVMGHRFTGHLIERGIDVVHTHDVYTNSFAIPWARLRTRCGVLASRRWTEAVPRPALALVNRIACGFAHRILANSDGVADFMVRRERVPRGKIMVLPNFVSDGAFSRVSGVERQRQRAAWGMPPATFVIGCVSRLVPVKNHDFLIRTLAALPAEFRLVLVGDGPSRRELESRAVQLGVAERVHFAGEVVSPTNLHQFFDVSVLVSRSEGFPNSLVEALAAGRAVVATPVGGIPDLITHERTGLLVEQDNVDMLAAHISGIQQDPERANRLGMAGADRVRRHFHENVVIAQHGIAYDELAALAGRRPAPVD